MSIYKVCRALLQGQGGMAHPKVSPAPDSCLMDVLSVTSGYSPGFPLAESQLGSVTNQAIKLLFRIYGVPGLLQHV